MSAYGRGRWKQQDEDDWGLDEGLEMKEKKAGWNTGSK